MTKRVLITGINGFAGSYLSPLLAESGYEVTGTSHQHSDLPDGASEVHRIDLRNLDEVRAVVQDVSADFVVHLAAISFVGHGNVAEIYETNVVGTRNLLQALQEMPERPQSVVLTSSANVYGNSDKGVLDEGDEVSPVNDYAVSKIAMEYMAAQFSDRLNLVTVRPFNYTGRGQSANFLVPKIVEHMRSGASSIELGNTDVSRDFSDVRAVVQYLKLLMEAPSAMGGVFNICTGQAYSLQQIIVMCEEICKRKIDVRVNPAFVRPNEIKFLIGNPARLHACVGKVEPFSMRETLEWMLAS